MIAIIDYGAGNLQSVENALNRLGAESVVTATSSIIAAADRVIFPGVGHAKTAMNLLKTTGLDQTIRDLKQPVLGICLGMQLMCEWSEEGDTTGLGIFPSRVRKCSSGMRVPHMGWNNLENQQSRLFDGIDKVADFYFVHNYAAEVDQYTAATCEMVYPFAAAMARDNFFGVQFHPEKSGMVGQQLLRNFLKI